MILDALARPASRAAIIFVCALFGVTIFAVVFLAIELIKTGIR